MAIGQMASLFSSWNNSLVFSGLWPFFTSSAVMSSMPNHIACRPCSHRKNDRSIVTAAAAVTSHSSKQEYKKGHFPTISSVERHKLRSSSNVGSGSLKLPYVECRLVTTTLEPLARDSHHSKKCVRRSREGRNTRRTQSKRPSTLHCQELIAHLHAKMRRVAMARIFARERG